MSQICTSAPLTTPTAAPVDVADAGTIRMGAVNRLPAVPVPAEVADSGRIRLGAVNRLRAVTGV